MITLKDVAREAGVSIATVSCALSGKKAVRPETYTKIMDAVEKLKYIPNYSARNLKKKASNMVSVLLPGMRSQFYSGLFDGISSYLQSHGCGMYEDRRIYYPEFSRAYYRDDTAR